MVARELNLTLDEMHALVFDHIARSVRNKRKAMHAPTLSIQGEPVAPRTVILRDFDPNLRQCIFHTDSRSQKIVSLQQTKVAFLHAYDRRSQLQLRITGEAICSQQDTLTRSWWQRLSSFGKQVYLTHDTPGTVLAQPASQLSSEHQVDDEEGYRHFSVLSFSIEKIECLLLGRGQQRRSLHQWRGDQFSQHWLAP